MLLLWNYFVLSFSALLPLINPLGSAEHEVGGGFRHGTCYVA